MGARIAVVGGGIAGSLLALRLAELLGGSHVELYRDPTTSGLDATSVSGGLVRGFETELEECRLAVASLAELRSDPVLAHECGYRESSSCYFLRPEVDPAGQLAVLDTFVGGSARLVPAGQAARELGFGSRPEGTFAVVERYAGHIDPDAMRRYATRRAAQLGAQVHDQPVTAVGAGPVVTLADGVVRHADVVVVAAGAWTGALLPIPLRTRRIQYGVYPLPPAGLGCFVDELSTLYGRAYGDEAVLLGVATSAWGAAPGDNTPDPAYADRVSAVARTVLALAERLPPPRWLAAGVDCFAAEGGLRLRPVVGLPGVFSFTGGAGSAVKSVLASSRLAATELCVTTTGHPPSFCYPGPSPVLTQPDQGADTALR
ncbi:MAG TPA: FAD-dependent oxidoreductase [Micromonospora sp.]|nr:FAD-dependent oxidoreductase [Micromonospora sp.]